MLDELRDMLAVHSILQEGPRGLYATCDRLAGARAALVADSLRNRLASHTRIVWASFAPSATMVGDRTR